MPMSEMTDQEFNVWCMDKFMLPSDAIGRLQALSGRWPDSPDFPNNYCSSPELRELVHIWGQEMAKERMAAKDLR